jgi:aspartate carbamoyltransferase catalytic subunit
MLANASLFNAKMHYSLSETLKAEQPNVVMMLRVQHERMSSSFIPSEKEYAKIWGLSKERFIGLPESTIIMHPGPMNRGLEIDSIAADSKNSVVLEQVSNGVSVRMAVLFRLLSGDRAHG